MSNINIKLPWRDVGGGNRRETTIIVLLLLLLLLFLLPILTTTTTTNINPNCSDDNKPQKHGYAFLSKMNI